ncbi:MAG: hypothetical protein HY014_04605 [Acidobacteria bacterium]|nr:hypothetical protein [Acidobacteriota bacterium]MBI3487431.1 hypothetical protein [Acidobacteriota bacterium]
MPILLALPVLAVDPPRNLLGTFKATSFQKVDRLEGLPEPVQEAIHDLYKQKCDALQERMTRGSRDEMEKDPDWAAMSEQEKEDFFVFDTPGIANPGEKWTTGDAIPRSMLHRPRRRLIFGGTSPSLWFMYYERGGIGRHQHLLVIGKGDAGGYWLRWVRNSHLGEKGEPISRLMKQAATIRNEFLHEGAVWSASQEVAKSCLDGLPSLVSLFVSLHNLYIHPLVRSASSQP